MVRYNTRLAQKQQSENNTKKETSESPTKRNEMDNKNNTATSSIKPRSVRGRFNSIGRTQRQERSGRTGRGRGRGRNNRSPPFKRKAMKATSPPQELKQPPTSMNPSTHERQEKKNVKGGTEVKNKCNNQIDENKEMKSPHEEHSDKSTDDTTNNDGDIKAECPALVQAAAEIKEEIVQFEQNSILTFSKI